MKYILLMFGVFLLGQSCVGVPKTEGETHELSDEEMKNRVEVEEIEFDAEEEFKDSTNVQVSVDIERTSPSSSLGKMENEVCREFPPLEIYTSGHDEAAHVNILSTYPRSKKTVRMRCIPPLSPSDLTQVPDEYGVYDFPDSEAKYPGGVHEMKTFIAENLKYPNPIGCYQGRVYVTFLVEKDGCVTHAEVMRGGISKELNEEALRVVRAMPKWIPAKHNGKVVAARLRLPINFDLH